MVWLAMSLLLRRTNSSFISPALLINDYNILATTKSFDRFKSSFVSLHFKIMQPYTRKRMIMVVHINIDLVSLSLSFKLIYQ